MSRADGNGARECALPMRDNPDQRGRHAGEDHRHQRQETGRGNAADQHSARWTNPRRRSAETKSVLGKRADVIEWRIDYFEGIADTAVVLEVARAIRSAAGDTPIILTRRSIREGGEPIGLHDEGVVRLYEAVCAGHSVDFVDFEMSNDAEHVRRVVAAARKADTRVILSYDNFSFTPRVEFLVQRFLEAERLGGDVGKVAVMPRDRADVLTLLAATVRATRRRASR